MLQHLWLGRLLCSHGQQLAKGKLTQLQLVVKPQRQRLKWRQPACPALRLLPPRKHLAASGCETQAVQGPSGLTNPAVCVLGLRKASAGLPQLCLRSLRLYFFALYNWDQRTVRGFVKRGGKGQWIYGKKAWVVSCCHFASITCIVNAIQMAPLDLCGSFLTQVC